MTEILYQDDHILVVIKPAGMATIPEGWDREAPSLVKLLEAAYGHIWIVHRLDKTTSGVLVFARTAESHRALSLQFERGEAQKVYHAICEGVPPWTEHTARHPLRVDVGHGHRTVVDHGKGKPAETCFKVLERFREHALLESLPRTGRTHQIRAHLSALGFPLLGDLLYSAPKTNLIPRPALHARSLMLIHPVTGERLTFTAPYPEDFAEAVQKLRAG